MNHINSLVVEGIVESEPLTVKEIGHEYVLLKITCNKVCKNPNGEKEEYISHFDVKNFGLVAEIVKNRCKVGEQVRIVGSLRQEQYTDENGKETSRIVIINEHIEGKGW